MIVSLSIYIVITAGEVDNSKAAPSLIDSLPYADYVVADKGYDSEAIREKIRGKNAFLSYLESKIQRQETLI